MVETKLMDWVEDTDKLKSVEEIRKRFGQNSWQNHEIIAIHHRNHSLNIVKLTSTQLKVVSQYIIMHISYEFGHDNIDILP